jgi:hypothetical protein
MRKSLPMGTNVIKSALILALWALFWPALFAKPPAQIDRIRRGMTPEEARPFVGQPQLVSRQILLRRHLEQWQFDEPQAFIEWNHQRGEIPYVLQVQKLNDD